MSAPWEQTSGFNVNSLSNPYHRLMNTSGVAFRDHAGSMVSTAIYAGSKLCFKLIGLLLGRISATQHCNSRKKRSRLAAISYANFIRAQRTSCWSKGSKECFIKCTGKNLNRHAMHVLNPNMNDDNQTNTIIGKQGSILCCSATESNSQWLTHLLRQQHPACIISNLDNHNATGTVSVV